MLKEADRNMARFFYVSEPKLRVFVNLFIRLLESTKNPLPF